MTADCKKNANTRNGRKKMHVVRTEKKTTQQNNHISFENQYKTPTLEHMFCQSLPMISRKNINDCMAIKKVVSLKSKPNWNQTIYFNEQLRIASSKRVICTFNVVSICNALFNLFDTCQTDTIILGVYHWEKMLHFYLIYTL